MDVHAYSEGRPMGVQMKMDTAITEKKNRSKIAKLVCGMVER